MKSKYYLLALIPLSLVGLVLRTVQILNGVEADTLFFVNDAAVNTVFHVFLVFALLFFLSGLILLGNERRPLDRFMIRIRKPERVLLLVFAIVNLAAELFVFFNDLISGTSSLSLWRVLCALLALTFMSAYVAAPKVLSKNVAVRFLSLSFTVYYAVRLLDVFVNMSMIQLSYKGPMILLCAACTLFFLSFSKALSGITSRKTLVVFGCCTVFLGVVNFGNFVAFIFSPEHAMQETWPAFAADVLLIAVAFLLTAKPFVKKQVSEFTDKETENKK